MSTYAYLLAAVVSGRFIRSAVKRAVEGEFPGDWDTWDEIMVTTVTLFACLAWPLVIIGIALHHLWTRP